MKYKDNELTEDELKEVTAGIKDGKTEEMLNKLSVKELEQLKDEVVKGNNFSKDRELSMDELDNIKAAIPKELVESEIEKNKDIFINK